MTDQLQTLVARGVITARMAEAGRLWAGDREVGEPASGFCALRAERARAGGGGGLDMRAVARRRWREASERLEEFRGVCEAVVFRGVPPSKWAVDAGKPAQVGAEFLRLGLSRLAGYYQLQAEAA